MSDPQLAKDPWTVLRVLNWTQTRFAELGLSTPRLDAELLIGSALSLSRVQVYTNFDRPLNSDELAAVRALVKRRLAREPVAYILGTKEFYGRPFHVDPRVLIPRPDTEVLIEEALLVLPAREESPRRRVVVDVGTGSGILAITLALERADLSGLAVIATDRHPAPLEVARANALALGAKVELCRGDLLAPFRGPIDLLVSNPPYLTPAELAQAAPELQREPKSAFIGGETGLWHLERLIGQAASVLAPGGFVLLEIGSSQRAAVTALLERASVFSDIRVRDDYAGQPRVAIARRAV